MSRWALMLALATLLLAGSNASAKDAPAPSPAAAYVNTASLPPEGAFGPGGANESATASSAGDGTQAGGDGRGGGGNQSPSPAVDGVVASSDSSPPADVGPGGYPTSPSPSPSPTPAPAPSPSPVAAPSPAPAPSSGGGGGRAPATSVPAPPTAVPAQAPTVGPAASPPPPPPPSPGSDFNITAESPSPSPSPTPSPTPSPSPDSGGGKVPATSTPSPPDGPNPLYPGDPPSPAPAPTPAPAPAPGAAAPPPPLGPNSQATALLDFKTGLDAASQLLLSSWTSNTANPCTANWLGVQCDQDDLLVTLLQLSGQSLSGPLSDSLGELTGLTQLDLSGNTLTGTLPVTWRSPPPDGGVAPVLASLLLDGNNLNGSLPQLQLPSLINATLQNNQLTGSIPSSWASGVPANATIVVLPQGGGSGPAAGGLCGDVPSAPRLAIEASPGSFYALSNSLGSCFAPSCPTNDKPLAGTNVFDVAWNNDATVWDVAAQQGVPNGEVSIPCYAEGSPVGGYLGGDMAFQMAAWNNGPAKPGAVVASKPGTSVECSTPQGTMWTVDLRVSLQLSQIVVAGGPAGGISDVTLSVAGSLSDQATPCASVAKLQSSTTVVPCDATGRYLTLTSSASMFLCSVAVYPAVATTAANKLFYTTSSDGTVLSGVNDGSAVEVSAAGNGSPQYVLDIGNTAGVAVVSFTGTSQGNVVTVSVVGANPLLAASPSPAPGRRRLAQTPAGPAPESAVASGVCNESLSGSTSYECEGAQGQWVVVTGVAGGVLKLANVAVYLTTPPAGPLSPPPGPAPPSPPPVPYQTQWVGNLLVGGNIATFIPTEPYTTTLLSAYNSAWKKALADAGYTMDTSASYFLPGGVSVNVSNIQSAPYYYTGDATGANVFTNTSVAVDSRLTPALLYSLLDTPAVAQAIQDGISGTGWDPQDIAMVPYSSPSPSPPPPSPSSGGGLSTGVIAGIAAGGAVALAAAAAIVWMCCCRGRRRGLGKGSLGPDDGNAVELGQYSGGGKPPLGPPSSQLSQAQKLYAEQHGGAALDYGSAFSNGAGGSNGSAAAAAAAGGVGLAALAVGSGHSRNTSLESSSQLGGAGAGAGGDATPRQSAADDPLLEWILKTQSPPVASSGGTEGAASAKARATVEAVSLAAAGAAASEGEGDDGAKRGTPRHRSSASKALDVRVWQFNFRDLQIQKQIGEGSFGRVYLAKWRETLVAVKILMNTGVDIEDADDAERALTLSNPVLESLEKEASMMAALRHPNVVAFLGVCATPPCVATEYCGRGSLTDVLRGGKNSAVKARQLDWARRLNMALDAAKGMLYLHAHSPPIIHRDLKSPNLLVDKHWRVKVSDFNLSKLMEENSVMSSMAATNPRWLAPEILAGASASYASDVYAYGVVMWELLTWELPWGTTNPWQVVTIVSEGGRLELPPRERLPGPDSQSWGELGAFCALVARCWAHSPADRPNFQEVIAELRDMLERTLAAKGALGGEGPAQRPPSEASASQPPSLRGTPAPRAGGGAAPPDTPVSPGPAAPSRTVSDAGTDRGTPLSGYSSVGVEVGSLGSTPKVLDSAPGGPQAFRPPR